MGKETVQNVLALRFANAIFEPIWNRRYIDSIQITVAEEPGRRAPGRLLRDGRGAARHRPEPRHAGAGPHLDGAAGHHGRRAHPGREGEAPPGRGHPEPGRGRRRVGPRPSTTAGIIDGEKVVAYREEPDVDPHSRDRDLRGHEAGRRQLALGRGADLRPHRQAAAQAGHRGGAAVPAGPPPRLRPAQSAATCKPNALILRIQPDEGSALRFGAKVPGEAFRVRSVAWTSPTPRPSPAPAADGYERLLHDAMIGDATLFIRTDEVEQAWRIVDPVPAGLVRGRASPWPTTRPGAGDRTRPSCWSNGLATTGATRARPGPAGGRLAEPDEQGRSCRNRRVVDGGRPPSPNGHRLLARRAPEPGLHPGASRAGPTAQAVLRTAGRRGPAPRRLDAWSTSSWATNAACPPTTPTPTNAWCRESLLDRVGPVAAFHPMSCGDRSRRLRPADRPGSRPRPRPPGPRSRRPHGLALPRVDRRWMPRRDDGRAQHRSQRRNPHERMTLTLAGHRPGPAGRLHRRGRRPSERPGPECGPGPTSRPAGSGPPRSVDRGPDAAGEPAMTPWPAAMTRRRQGPPLR